MPDRNEDIRNIKEALQDDYSDYQPERKQDATAAPLFVKVDKYKEVLTGIQEMKIFLSGLKQIFTVMNEIEEMRIQSINVLRATMQRLEKSVVEIDSGLLRPKGVDMRTLTQAEPDMHRIEDSLTDLQTQIKDLKKVLHEMH